MGERAVAGEPATEEDMAAMARLVRQALEAGALGFTTGRSDVHRTADGEWTPASEAAPSELEAIARAFHGLGHGVLQAVSDFDLERDPKAFDREWQVVERFFAASGGRPASLSLMQRDFAPEQWRWILARAEAAKARGLAIRMQVAPRAIGVMVGLDCTFHPFMGFPSYKRIAHLPLEERVRVMREPAFKQRLLGEKSEPLAGDGSPIPPLADRFLAAPELAARKLFALGEEPDYEQPPERSLYARAMAAGRAPLELLYDTLLEDEGRALLYFPVYNYTEFSYRNVLEMMTHPLALAGLSDAGAHVGTICDASFPTYLLKHWTRERTRGPRLPLERVVAMLTDETSRHMGLADRGRLEPGLKADLNVIDLEGLRLEAPRIVRDLPAGGRRLLQEARGYVATVVSGEPVMEHGVLTGDRPGRLIRGPVMPSRLAPLPPT
jgi:N-acyl-D-aspartate/D-glutamate deacylase